MDDSLMDKFCSSEFWNANKTWYTANPLFTPCFEKTVLVWVPCAFLWALSPLEVTYILNSKWKYIPWSRWNVTKTVLVWLLVLMSVVELGHSLSSYEFSSELSLVDIVASLTKTLTFILAAVLLEWNRRCGVRTSSILSMFWILLFFLSSPRLVSLFYFHQFSDSNYSTYIYVTYVLYYAIVLHVVVFSIVLSDGPPRHSKYPKIKKPCPFLGAPFLSRLCYFWFDKFMWSGFRTTHVENDLWSLNPWDSAKQKVPKISETVE